MARAFDVCMILHADHGLNNSDVHGARDHLDASATFTRRSPGAIGSLSAARCTAGPTRR